MGVFRVRVRVFSLGEAKGAREIDMLVDTGTTHPVIPRDLAAELGIEPMERRPFILANGATISREVGWAGLQYGERFTATTVILGEPEDPPLLGAIALEGMGLEVDPAARRLRPTTQWLLETLLRKNGATLP